MASPPFPGLWGQATSMVDSLLGGLAQQAVRSNRRTTRQGNRFIKRLTRQYVDELKAMSSGIGGVYDQSEGEMRAIDSAIGSYLSGSGQNMYADLEKQMDFAPGLAIDPRAVAQSLGKTAAGYSAADQRKIVGEAASEQAFGKAMPGIGALQGLQQASSFRASQGRALEDSLMSIRNQAPGLTTNLYGTFASQRMQQMQMAQEERLAHAQMQHERRMAAGNVDHWEEERLDNARAQAGELIRNQMIDPLTGDRKVPYAVALRRTIDAMASYYPGGSGKGLRQEAEKLIGQYGFVNPGRIMEATQNFFGRYGMASREEAAQRAASTSRFTSFQQQMNQRNPGLVRSGDDWWNR